MRSLLGDTEAREVSKTLPSYIARFEEEDRRRDQRKDRIDLLARRAVRDAFVSLVEARRTTWLADRPSRIAINAEEAEVLMATITQTIDEPVEEIVEVMP